MYVSVLPSPAYHRGQNRLWEFSAPPALRSGSACVSSGRPVAAEEYSRNRAYFQTLPRTPLNGRLPREVLAMYMKDPITARRFA